MNAAEDDFKKAYAGLNPEQKKAVDSIDGPVMVIAGPGTGKTQVLALRIANILSKTDTAADSILCLTFTNAGVKAMRERLLRYIGSEATRVRVATFHGFGMELIERYFASLGLPDAPRLLDDATSVTLLDELLTSHEWKHLRPRAFPTMYFRDIRSLISLLKREDISPRSFKETVAADIETLKTDPANLSTRGTSKGKLKKDIEKKIEGLERTLELADFYDLYESVKGERNYIDYNDVLSLMVALVRGNEDIRADLQEEFQYVLIDEHQDSTRLQNDFLEAVWKGSEQPNIFVVGDDRQLIYGFGGASLAYFEAFKHLFGKAALITLTSNYRSSQVILDAAETLLTSDLADGKLESNTADAHPITLVEAAYPREEIIAAAIAIKERIAEGVNPDSCAILMPKNRQVKAATQILRSMGLPVAAAQTLRLFDLPETEMFLRVLAIVNNPLDAVALANSVLDPLSGIPSIVAHVFLHERDTRTLTLPDISGSAVQEISAWGRRCEQWVDEAQTADLYALIQQIGNDLLLHSSTSDEVLRRRVEIIRTFLNLVSSFFEREEKITLGYFLEFINRLRDYEEDIPLAVFGAHRGIKVLTFHGSKGLEFEFVWIAHLDERSLTGSRRQMFTLPESVREKVEERDEMVAKRQLYVAMTRAKKYCTLSFAHFSHTGAEQQLANIIAALPEALFVRQPLDTLEALFLNDPKQAVLRVPPADEDTIAFLQEAVAREYVSCRVSVTLLNNFFECPWKWYFRNLLQLPEPMSESLHLGNVVHASIEYSLKNKLQDTQDLHSFIARYAQKEARQQENLARRLTSDATAIVDAWSSQYSTFFDRTYQTERSVSYHDPSFAELTIYGKIDVLEELSPGSVRVIDWKTGSPKTISEIEKEDEEGRMSTFLRQLAMYVYLLEGSSHNGLVVEEVQLVFVEAPADKQIVSRSIDSDDTERLRTDIKDYKHFVETGEWMTRPCCKKKYREGDVCEYCAMAVRMGLRTQKGHE